MKIKKIKLILLIIIFSILFKKNAYSNVLNNNNIVSFNPIVKKVLPSIVSIYTKKKKKHNIPNEFKYFFKNRNEKYLNKIGSGVIIDSKNGYIVTNNHVINNSVSIKIKLNDGSEYYTKLIGKDDLTDLAVLKILENKDNKLKEIKMSNSDTVKVGDFVIAIGNPFGLNNTVTSGIVSATERSNLNIINGIENFIQTDASINKGNSGGALINLKGELIGINTAIIAQGGGNLGIGFAIPSNIVNNLTKQILKYGKVKRGYLGIKGVDLTKEISKALKIKDNNGVLISEIIPKSPAYINGLKSGDIIVYINNKKIKNFIELRNVINTLIVEENVKITILRNNIFKNITLKLQEIHNEDVGKRINYNIFKGMVLIDSEKNKNKIVKVFYVYKNSKANKLGIRSNDYILSINNNNISSINDIKIMSKKKIDILFMNILRKNSKIFILVKKNF